MNIIGLLFGVGFGFMLGWARLTDYDVIRNMLLLREFDVYLMMGSAVAIAAIGTRILRALGTKSLIGRAPLAWSVTRPARNHVYGSILFGLGWGIAGTCPGPIAAQLGRGQLVALFTVAGVLTGVALYGYLKQRAENMAASSRRPEAQGTSPGL